MLLTGEITGGKSGGKRVLTVEVPADVDRIFLKSKKYLNK